MDYLAKDLAKTKNEEIFRVISTFANNIEVIRKKRHEKILTKDAEEKKKNKNNCTSAAHTEADGSHNKPGCLF